MIWIVAVVAVLVAVFVFLEADVVTLLCDFYRRKADSKCYRGKNVWIIGASSGIGEYLAYEFVKEGIEQLILSSRRVEELERVKKNCLKINSKCNIHIERLDLSDLITHEHSEEITSQFIEKTLNKLQTTIDILILNSGIIQYSMALDTSFKVTKKICDINTLSIALFAKVFINLFNEKHQRQVKRKEKNLQIAVTCSLAGKIAPPGSASYAMSKFGTLGYFGALATELNGSGMDNIDICVVCPGPIKLTDEARGGYDNKSEKNIQNKVFDRKIFEAKFPHMSLTRHSQLYLSAIYASKWGFFEAWIAPPYTLVLSYFHQYCPFLFTVICRFAASLYVKVVNDVNNQSVTKRY